MDKRKILNLINKIIMMILCVAVCLTATPVNLIQAEEVEEPKAVPTISATNTSVVAGDYAYVSINASDFENIAGLEYSIYYDADVMSLEYCYESYFVSESSTSTNKETAGTIKCSVLNVDGLNGSGELLNMAFYVNKETEAGTYPISIAIGAAYDTNLSSVTLEKTIGYVTVLESPNDAKEISFFTSLDNYWVYKDDVVTYILYGGETEGLVAGTFIFTYDSNLLELEDVKLGETLQTEKSIYSVNSEVPGVLKISYANIEAISEEYYVEYFVLSFRVKEADSSAIYTSIDFASESLLDENLGRLRAANSSCGFYIEAERIVNPVFTFEDGPEAATKGNFCVNVILGDNANVAAGDFTINYDSSQVICTSVEVDPAVKTNNGLLIYKEDIGNGSIKFSYATTSPFSSRQTILKLEFKPVDNFTGYTYMYATGRNVVDAKYNNLYLDYEGYNYEVVQSYLPGDVNNDGRISIKDVALVRKYIANNSTEINLLAADVSGDGRISMKDVALIRKIIAGN